MNIFDEYYAISQLATKKPEHMDRETIHLVLKILPGYTKVRGEGSKAEFIHRKYPFISISKAKKIDIVLSKASNKDLHSIMTGKETISSIYNKLLLRKNTLKQSKYIDEKDNYSVIYNKDGYFYYKHRKTKKEIRLFKLPLFLNKNEIKDAISKAIEENL